MAVETVLVNILSAVFAIIGGIILVKVVLPRVADVLDAAVEDQTAVDGLMVLLKVFVVVIVTGMVISAVTPLHAKLGMYLGTLQNGIDAILSIKTYGEWLVVGIGALLLVKIFTNKKK